MNTTGIDAIVFDFDGTIADTEQVEFESARLVCAEWGVELPIARWIDVVGTLHSPDLPTLIADATKLGSGK